MRKCLRARARSSGLAKESFCSMGFLNGEMDFLNVRSMVVVVGEARLDQCKCLMCGGGAA